MHLQLTKIIKRKEATSVITKLSNERIIIKVYLVHNEVGTSVNHPENVLSEVHSSLIIWQHYVKIIKNIKNMQLFLEKKVWNYRAFPNTKFVYDIIIIND